MIIVEEATKNSIALFSQLLLISQCEENPGVLIDLSTKGYPLLIYRNKFTAPAPITEREITFFA